MATSSPLFNLTSARVYIDLLFLNSPIIISIWILNFEFLIVMAAGIRTMLFEKLWRFIRTVYFMVVMVASLLVLSLPVLVAIGDVLVPCVLISSFTCVNCYSFKEHLSRYSFRTSLTDIPVVSIVRSLIITCMYLFRIGFPLFLNALCFEL